ncbi:MAG: FAD synthetase family protein, partial [Clostridia bacterium]|nr:FAD synthetase family protein [Clostridia bacterium]
MNWNGKKMQTSKTAVALGFFDGVHIGHMSLINKIKELENEGLKSCVYTFDKHPSEIFGQGVELICSFEDKIKLLEETGVNLVYVQKADKLFLSLSPEEFVKKVLIDKLNAAHVVAGENFTFGKNKSGNADVLKKLCAENGIKCTIMPCKMVGDTIVSSTEIRKMIAEGNIRKANEFLGKNYGYRGLVKPGTHIGVK